MQSLKGKHEEENKEQQQKTQHPRLKSASGHEDREQCHGPAQGGQKAGASLHQQLEPPKYPEGPHHADGPKCLPGQGEPVRKRHFQTLAFNAKLHLASGSTVHKI